MTYRKDDKKDDLIKLIEKTTPTEEDPIYIYIYIYIYILIGEVERKSN